MSETAIKNTSGTASRPFDGLSMLVNMDTLTSERECENLANSLAVKLETAGARFNEQTIMVKTNVGLSMFRAAIIRVDRAKAEGGKITLPAVDKCTAGVLVKILGLTDTPAEGDKPCVERYGYKVNSLGACVDLARGIIGGYDEAARAKLTDDGESISERNLRSAILAKINPNAEGNRAKGARETKAAKIALVKGVAAGGTVKVDGKTVKVDAKKLTDVKNLTSASLLTDERMASATDEQIAHTIRALQLVAAARAAGAVKAPAVAKKVAAKK